MQFDDQLRQAIKIAERLGTWVIYAVRDARDLQHLVGYLSYRIDDFDRRKCRKTTTAGRAYFSQRISHWRRAVRWVASLDPERYGVIAERIIERIEAHPEHRDLPYVSDAEVEKHTPPGAVQTRRAKLSARPTRRAGRPRTRSALPKSWHTCGECGGIGTVRG